MDAILSATVQVLLAEGQERMTTTRVAYRAGVSVGTLYQYFPNKQALLRAVLERHLGEVVDAVETACSEHHGQPLEAMARGTVNAFLNAKMKSVSASTALYAIAAGVDGARIGREMADRAANAVAAMLLTAPHEFATDPLRLAQILYGVFAGISRRLLEAPDPHKLLDSYRDELIRLATAYLSASLREPLRVAV